MDQTTLESLIEILNSPELTVAVLLILFATKRIVPYWVFDPLMKELLEFREKEADIRKELGEIREELRKKD